MISATPACPRWLACCLGMVALTATVPGAAATRYVFSTFKGDAAANEKLSIYTSSDGLNFTLLSDTGYSGPSGVLRDPSLMKHSDGQYYVAYTLQSWDTSSTSFGIAKSADLTHWTFLAEVPAQVSGAKHTWAPEWFKDTDGSVHLIVSVDSPEWDFKPYLYTATDDALTQWSAPTALGFGPNYIDTFVVVAGSTYHAFCKNETTKYIEHATARNLLGPWTFVGTGDWARWGSGKEGITLFSLDSGDWRMFLDCYGGCGYLYATSSDLTQWSSTATVPGGLSGTVRHGTVLRETTSGGASSTGGSSAAAAGGKGSAGGTGATGGNRTGGASAVAGNSASGASTQSSGGATALGGTSTSGKATGGVDGSGGVDGAGGALSGGGGTPASGGRRSSTSSATQAQGGSGALGGSTPNARAIGGTGPAQAGVGGQTTLGGAAVTGGASNSSWTAQAGGQRTGSADSVTSVRNVAGAESRSGCSCSVPQRSRYGAWALALFAALGAARRRRPAREQI